MRPTRQPKISDGTTSRSLPAPRRPYIDPFVAFRASRHHVYVPLAPRGGMGKITIIGAGISSLASARALSAAGHEVTIVARDLPPANGTPISLDGESTQWASPWAGAIFIADVDASPAVRRMQRDAYLALAELAAAHPESSIHAREMQDVRDDGTRLEDVWYRELVPGFREMAREELPEGATLGMQYQSFVMNPTVLLPWLRKRLEDAGVKFVQKELKSLDDVKGMGHDVLVNASGWGARFLGGVEDPAVQLVRGQTHLMRTWWDKVFIRQGNQYTYCIPRGDGTAIVGGVKDVGNLNTAVSDDQRMDIFDRIGANLPHVFGAYPADFDVVRENVGIRPGREGGVRVEKEVINGQKVVHAYGAGGSGYVFSFGLGKAVGELVESFLSTSAKAKL